MQAFPSSAHRSCSKQQPLLRELSPGSLLEGLLSPARMLRAELRRDRCPSGWTSCPFCPGPMGGTYLESLRGERSVLRKGGAAQGRPPRQRRTNKVSFASPHPFTFIPPRSPCPHPTPSRPCNHSSPGLQPLRFWKLEQCYLNFTVPMITRALC